MSGLAELEIGFCKYSAGHAGISLLCNHHHRVLFVHLRHFLQHVE